MLIKKISKIGNSWGIIIPPSIWELMSINTVKDQISIEVENNAIIIKKHKQENNK